MTGISAYQRLTGLRCMRPPSEDNSVAVFERARAPEHSNPLLDMSYDVHAFPHVVGMERAYDRGRQIESSRVR